MGLLIVIIVSSLPLLLLLVMYWLFVMQPVRILSKLRCSSCDSQYGYSASRAAQKSYRSGQREAAKQIHAEFSGGAFISWTNEWDVTCPTCGKSAVFNEAKNKLVSNTIAKT